ncbi:DUF7344 domain-containing protein [Halalkalicoccus salilacus]|uniref:DUF7344 domain-containing protein n=1 Tax=Halalkalicoccus TaxID=332246 RepID=UPI002F96679D
MSNTLPRSSLLVTTSVSRASDKRRWYALRYLRECTYPATVTELSEHVAPRLGTTPEDVERALRDDDLPALAECDAIKYDPRSGLACLADEREPFAEHARRAITAGAISHLKPPNHKLTRTAPSIDV